MKGGALLPPQPVEGDPSHFPSLPFLTDNYLPGPQSIAAAQQHQLRLRETPSEQAAAAAAAAASRMSAAAAEGWGEPNSAASLHLWESHRDGADRDHLLSSVQEPSPFGGSSYNSIVCSPSGFSIDSPQGSQEGAFSSLPPAHLTSCAEAANNCFVGYFPSAGLPLYSGPSLPLSSGVVTPERPLEASNKNFLLPQKNFTQEAQGFASDYDRLTRELGKHCASLRDMATDFLSFADELNVTLESAIHSAGQVTQVQRKLLLSASQQKHLVADSKLIHSKVQTLHRLLLKASPQYGQWLKDHVTLRDHIKQLEQQQHNDAAKARIAEGNENISHNTNWPVSRCTHGSSGSKRRSTRQYKRKQLRVQRDLPEGSFFSSIKCERASSCS